MTSSLAQAILAVSGSIDASIVAKATLVMGVTLLALRYAARQARASVRHVMLAAAFGGLLILPAAELMMPRTLIAIRVAQPVQTVEPLPAVVGSRVIAEALSSTGATVAQPGQPIDPQFPWPTVATLLRATWLMGTFLFLAPLAVSLWRLRNVGHRGSRWPAGDELVRAIAIRSGVRRPVTLRLHEDAIVPVTYGVLKPVVLLPLDVQEWSDRELRHALTHELEHVRRGDWIVNLLSRTVCAAYWFLPLPWIGLRALSLESERACDDAVVREADHAVYADHLLKLAERLSNGIAHPVLSIANRSQLATRIAAILNCGQRRGRPNVAVAAVIATTALAFVLALAPLSAVARVVPPSIQIAQKLADPTPIAQIPVVPPRVPGPAAQDAPSGPPSRPADGHVIRPNETLSISIFDGRSEPRSVYRVDETGMVTLPLIGAMQAAGKSVSEFMDDLAKRLASATPKVEAGAGLEVVYVTGAVRAPQAIQMQDKLTLLDALVMAGSPAPDAGDEVQIVRRSGLNVVNLRILDLKADAANTLLQDGDTVFVPVAKHYALSGEIRNPGTYNWSSGLTVEEAIARAGGPTDRGSMSLTGARRRIGGTLSYVLVTAQDEVLPDDVISIARRIF